MVFLTLALYDKLGIEELLIEFGTGKDMHFINISPMHKSIHIGKVKTSLLFCNFFK